jgi:head-tail adaptor
MKGGRLDRFIAIQRKTTGQSESGDPIESWTNIVVRRRAGVSPVRGDEKFSSPEIAAKQQTQFTIRYSEDVADVSPLDRIIYPAPDFDSSPVVIPENTIYDIVSVPELGRREGLRILAVRRADAQ